MASLSSNLPPRIFGCTVFVHINPNHSSKLDPRAHKCVFIGYSPHQKGYKCYSPTTQQTYNTRDVTFFETQSFFHHTEFDGETTNDSETPSWDLIPLEDNTTVHSTENSINAVSESSTIAAPEPVGTPTVSELVASDSAKSIEAASEQHFENQQPELLVYTRRPRPDNLASEPKETGEPDVAIPEVSIPMFDTNLDILVAIRKGV